MKIKSYRLVKINSNGIEVHKLKEENSEIYLPQPLNQILLPGINHYFEFHVH